MKFEVFLGVKKDVVKEMGRREAVQRLKGEAGSFQFPGSDAAMNRRQHRWVFIHSFACKMPSGRNLSKEIDARAANDMVCG
jgi:hypothetical protein